MRSFDPTALGVKALQTEREKAARKVSSPVIEHLGQIRSQNKAGFETLYDSRRGHTTDHLIEPRHARCHRGTVSMHKRPQPFRHDLLSAQPAHMHAVLPEPHVDDAHSGKALCGEDRNPSVSLRNAQSTHPLRIYCRHWLHSEMWWPRLFASHEEIAWDDYEKDYSDLPAEVWLHPRQICDDTDCREAVWAAMLRGCSYPDFDPMHARKTIFVRPTTMTVAPSYWHSAQSYCGPAWQRSGLRPLAAAQSQVMQQHRVAEAIKDVERRLETAEKSRRERLQVSRVPDETGSRAFNDWQAQCWLPLYSARPVAFPGFHFVKPAPAICICHRRLSVLKFTNGPAAPVVTSTETSARACEVCRRLMRSHHRHLCADDVLCCCEA